MEKAEFNVGKKNLTFIKTSKDYSISFNSIILSPKARHRSGLKLSFTPSLTSRSTSIEAENEQRNLFNAFVLNETIAEIILGELRKTLYLGPFRQAPLRRYQTRGSSPLEVGYKAKLLLLYLLMNMYRAKLDRILKK